MVALPLPLCDARLQLRQMTRADAADLCRIVTQPQVGRMLFLFPPDWTEAAAGDFIDRWRFAGALPFRLAVADPSGRFLGSVGAFSGAEPEVFYFLDPATTGRGLGSEAMAAFVALMFAHFPVPALRADVFDDNPASMRVLEKLDFHAIGTGMGRSAARLEPAPVVHYRLERDKRAVSA